MCDHLLSAATNSSHFGWSLTKDSTVSRKYSSTEWGACAKKLSWSIASGYEYLWLRKDRREDATVFIFGEYWFACILSQIDATLQEFQIHLPWIVQLITRKQPDWTGNWTSSPRRMSAIQRCFCFVFCFFSVSVSISQPSSQSLHCLVSLSYPSLLPQPRVGDIFIRPVTKTPQYPVDICSALTYLKQG